MVEEGDPPAMLCQEAIRHFCKGSLRTGLYARELTVHLAIRDEVITEYQGSEEIICVTVVPTANRAFGR